MSPFSKTIFYRLPVVALCLVIFWQSSFPGITSEPMFPNDDKVLHFLVYGLLAFLSVRCLSVESVEPAKAFRIAVLFTILYGLSDEIHQSFIPERVASVSDLLADAIGAFAGAAAFLIADRFYNQTRREIK